MLLSMFSYSVCVLLEIYNIILICLNNNYNGYLGSDPLFPLSLSPFFFFHTRTDATLYLATLLLFIAIRL